MGQEIQGDEIELTLEQKLHLRELQLKKLEIVLHIKELEQVMAHARSAEMATAKEIEDYISSIANSDRVLLKSNGTLFRVK